MGIHDRDWYKEAMRERERAPQSQNKPEHLIYYAPTRPIRLVGKAILIAAALIAAAASWRYLR